MNEVTTISRSYNFKRLALLFDKKVIVFLHTPKCGGTSLDRGLRTLFGRTHHYRIDGAKHRDLSETSPEQKTEIRVLSGHFRFGAPYVEALARAPLYVTTVREPISRVQSYYAYFRQKYAAHPDEKRLQRFGQGTINEVVTAMMDEDHFFTRNDLCKTIAGVYSFDLARDNIERNYLAVITPMAIDDLLDIARLVFDPGRPTLPQVRRNASGSDDYSFSPEVEERLRERTSEDAKLYEWVKQNEDANLVAVERRLKALVSDYGQVPMPPLKKTKKTKKDSGNALDAGSPQQSAN